MEELCKVLQTMWKKGEVGMSNREKIISAIEKAKKQSEGNAQDAIIVPFKEANMILALLKEQEAVPVVQREVMHMLVWCCGSCGVAITDGDKFCRMCGKEVKWNA